MEPRASNRTHCVFAEASFRLAPPVTRAILCWKAAGTKSIRLSCQIRQPCVWAGLEETNSEKENQFCSLTGSWNLASFSERDIVAFKTLYYTAKKEKNVKERKKQNYSKKYESKADLHSTAKCRLLFSPQRQSMRRHRGSQPHHHHSERVFATWLGFLLIKIPRKIRKQARHRQRWKGTQWLGFILREDGQDRGREEVGDEGTPETSKQGTGDTESHGDQSLQIGNPYLSPRQDVV